jgi:hypothetical protein
VKQPVADTPAEVLADVPVEGAADVGRPAGRIQTYVGIAGLVVVVFLASYSFAAGGSPRAGAGAVPASAAGPGAGPQSAPVGAAASASCACCGGGAGASVAGEARAEGGIQRITVDTSSGSWSPNEITLKAGIPAEITFAEGQGCLAQVVFPDLGVRADLRNGGAVVNLPALEAGEHAFACGMDMVFGKLIVR